MRGERERDRSAVILDKHPLWLDALRKLVTSVGVVTTGVTTSQKDAVNMIAEHRVDVFIAGVDPLQTDEIACVREAMLVHSGLKTVVVADSVEPDAIKAAFGAGATVYCAKTAEQEDLASAIRQLFDRSIYISSSSDPYSLARSVPTRVEPTSHNLTPRELEILRLAAEGSSNSQLAQMLWVTEQTVKFHLSNIYRKLNVTNRTEASRWAQVNGLLVSDHEGETAGAPVAA